jgi:hypothetical protein
MFYSTRYFFRLAGLFLAAYLVYTRLPDILGGIKNIWEYAGLFFSRYTRDDAISLVYEALYNLIRRAR